MTVLSNCEQYQKIGNHNVYTANGVSGEFKSSVINTVEKMENYSPASKAAVDKLKNIIILKDTNSEIPKQFPQTNEKFHTYASDAYGFVSKSDNAIVLIEDNHKRKNAVLEGNTASQGADTFTHETGHLIDKELSTTEIFKSAYLKDLKNLEFALKEGNSTVYGENLQEMVNYLHHYIEGVNFEDGIDESDISREGLRENFAECFSTMSDSSPSKINLIFSALFPNTMNAAKKLTL